MKLYFIKHLNKNVQYSLYDDSNVNTVGREVRSVEGQKKTIAVGMTIMKSKHHTTIEEFQKLLDTAPVVKITDAVPKEIKLYSVSKGFEQYGD